MTTMTKYTEQQLIYWTKPSSDSESAKLENAASMVSDAVKDSEFCWLAQSSIGMFCSYQYLKSDSYRHELSICFWNSIESLRWLKTISNHCFRVILAPSAIQPIHILILNQSSKILQMLGMTSLLLFWPLQAYFIDLVGQF